MRGPLNAQVGSSLVSKLSSLYYILVVSRFRYTVSKKRLVLITLMTVVSSRFSKFLYCLLCVGKSGNLRNGVRGPPELRV